jgi:hypothetical protein
MQRVRFATSSFLTGDAIADALVSYTAFLFENGTSSYVDVPVRHPDGSERRAWFLLGPSGQLFSEPEASPWSEIEDNELVTRLRSYSTDESGFPRSFAGEYFHLHRFDGVRLITPRARS